MSIQTIQDLQERINSVLVSNTAGESLGTKITYQADANAIITQYISEYTNGVNGIISNWDYTYDTQGRIRTIFKDGSLAASFQYERSWIGTPPRWLWNIIIIGTAICPPV